MKTLTNIHFRVNVVNVGECFTLMAPVRKIVFHRARGTGTFTNIHNIHPDQIGMGLQNIHLPRVVAS